MILVEVSIYIIPGIRIGDTVGDEDLHIWRWYPSNRDGDKCGIYLHAVVPLFRLGLRHSVPTTDFCGIYQRD